MAKQEVKSDSEHSNRMWASASFVGVLIVIGVPLWWKTTEVYRVALPSDKISAFNTLPHTITTQLTILADDYTTAAEISGLIEKAFENSDIINLKINKAVLSDELHHILNAVSDDSEAVEEVASAYDLTKHNSFYVVQRKPLFQDVWLSGERVAFFRDSKAAQILVETLKHWVYQTSVLRGVLSDTADVARQTRLSLADGYHIVLSVVHPQPDFMNVEFNAEDAVEDYLGSFVDELSVLHNVTLKSQWIYLLEFDFKATPKQDTSDWTRHFAVRRDHLHALLTRLEERAAPRVAQLPAVSLALYAVPCNIAPLVIYDDDGKLIASPVQAFMSPKWGGVFLGNPTVSECRLDVPATTNKPTYRPNVRVVMGTFISQLRKLFGITDVDHIKGAHLEPLRSVVPRRWEIDNLLRLRTLEQVTSAERTLQSLNQLLGKISNIVINDEVGASINEAVERIHVATKLMAEGELVEAYRNSQAAFKAAETAFMEPSLLALLYFPDDQKYAVYVPLFLPVMFPVLLSLKNLFLWARGKPINKAKAE